MKKFYVLFFLFCTGLNYGLSARQNAFYSDAVLDELRLELSDVKHELHSARIEINLLEEKITKQDRVLSDSKGQEKKAASSQFDLLEKKIDRLEKILDKALTDLRTLSAQENRAIAKVQELESVLAAQEKKLEEIAKLRNTLTTISKAIGQSVKATATRFAQTYNVKPGDSLEKIAQAHHTTVDALKALNQLKSDKILVGQELTISTNEHK